MFQILTLQREVLRRTSNQVRNLLDTCRLSEVLSKSIKLENRCYHRPGLFDDDDFASSNDKQDFSKQSRQRNFNQYNTQRTPYFKQKRQFNPRNFYGNQNGGMYPNQFSHPSNQSFGQDLVDVTFNKDELPPVEKYLYSEHPDVTQRSTKETESYRKSVNMCITGSDVPNPILDFHEFCLPDDIKKIVADQGYSKPTPIQSQGWPIVLSGRDMVGISQTGSGKTLVYMLPAIIHALNQPQLKMKNNDCAPLVLVLAPTRELVQQILQVNKVFCDTTGLISSCAYGGASKNVQLSCLRGAHICIATPGRLIDFISEGSVSLKKCTYLVLDEADRMLDMGFEPQIRKIVGQIRPDRQTLMWSATWPREIQNLAEDFLSNYVKVTIGSGQLVANPNIEQQIYIVKEIEKEERLISLLEKITAESESKVLIFAQTKKMVDYLGMGLNRAGINSLVIHGDVSQARRDYALNYFRKQKGCVLIATDVAARGLDITDVHHVINYDFPLNIEDYIHRIGRTARGASSGVSHSFITSANAGIISDLITVLEQAKQSINPELYALLENKYRNRGRPLQWQRHQYASR